MNSFWARYDAFENDLIQQFRQHRFFERVSQFSDARYTNYLLQRALLSLEFERWQLTALLGLRAEAAKQVVRHIIKEEIPRGRPTHKENLLHDLNQIGVSTWRFRMTRPSTKTRQTIKTTYQLVRYREDDYDLCTLVSLRVAGEIMVAETYRHVLPELERRFGLRPEDSSFYRPHYEHDQKGGMSDYSEVGHADSFEELLASLIHDERSLSVAVEAAQQAMRAPYAFHDQFLPRYKVRIATRWALTMSVAAALLFAASRPLGETYQRSLYRRFLASLPVTERQFYLETDRQLIAQAAQTGSLHYLRMMGTAGAVRALWGDGP